MGYLEQNFMLCWSWVRTWTCILKGVSNRMLSFNRERARPLNSETQTRISKRRAAKRHYEAEAERKGVCPLRQFLYQRVRFGWGHDSQKEMFQAWLLCVWEPCCSWECFIAVKGASSIASREPVSCVTRFLNARSCKHVWLNIAKRKLKGSGTEG